MTPDLDLEHLTDMLDIASRRTMRENDFLIKDRALRAAPKQFQVHDSEGNPYWRVTECDSCGEELEPHRLPMCRCVHCQHKAEILERQHARIL